MQFEWYLNRFGLESLACTVLAASASVLHRILWALFRAICNILSRISFRISFRLVRVYLGITSG